MPRHHRFKSASSSQFTWAASDSAKQDWARYLGDCKQVEGGIPITSVPRDSVLELAKGFYLQVNNDARNNFLLALNFLPRASSATGLSLIHI